MVVVKFKGDLVGFLKWDKIVTSEIYTIGLKF